MVILQSAASIAEVAHANRQIFIKEVLEGPVFRSMVQGIEEAALAGKNEYHLYLEENESSETRDVLLDTLKLAGYITLYLMGDVITIKWGKTDKK